MTDYWRKYVGAVDSGTPRWSASTASANRRRRPELFKHFGFTVENVVAAVKRVTELKRSTDSRVK